MRQQNDTRLVRFLAGHAVTGGLIALATVALLVIGDVGGLRSLILRSDAGFLALAVMTSFFIITFASVQMAVAVALQGEDRTGGRGRRDMPSGYQLQPIRVEARRPLTRRHLD